jgi:hypothetical protein
LPEPVWVAGVRGGEDLGAQGLDLGGGAVVDRGRGVQADAAVAVLMVVGEEQDLDVVRNPAITRVDDIVGTRRRSADFAAWFS